MRKGGSKLRLAFQRSTRSSNVRPQASARAASSGLASGTPNRTRAPSPANLSIMPPWQSSRLDDAAPKRRDEDGEPRRVHVLAKRRGIADVDEQQRGGNALPGAQGVESAVGENRRELARQITGEVDPQRRFAHRALEQQASLAGHQNQDERRRQHHHDAHDIGLRRKETAELPGICRGLAGGHRMARRKP